MFRETIRKTMMILGLSTAMLGTSLSAGTPVQAASKTIVIGEDDSMTGALAFLGMPQHNAIQLAVDTINAKGGIRVKGTTYKLKLVALDDQGNPTLANTNIQKLVDVYHAQFLVGFVGGVFVQPAFPFIEKRKIPTLVGTAADRTITASGNPYVFHDRVPTDYTGVSSGEYLGKVLHVKRMVILGDLEQQFQWDLVNGVKQGLAKYGGKVTSIQNVPNTATDATSQITAALATHPDTMYVFNSVNAAAFIFKQARQLGFKGRFVGFTGGSAEQFEKIDPPSLLQGILELIPAELDPSTPQINGPYARTFIQQYQKTFHQTPTPNTGYGFDLVTSLAAAIEKAQSLDPDAVVKALHQIPVPKMTTLKWIPVNGHMYDQNGQAYVPNAVFKFQGNDWHFVAPLPSPVKEYSAGLAKSAAKAKH